ncbi:hypothetical protein FA15DRAFT_657101 [Coprinopsis marcescibilis]|uniref:Uncharacterized protein n=1 Tax=Coprinopsis marcescibilis TaxID=230819 RepID=A0A5C3KS01_COPMA|nr:hypothetical protein FA15DRAFT_657101 [Coprinopsis marcescibilis]
MVFLLLLMLMIASSVLGALQIRTIDDTYGDSVTGLRPVYSPEGGWADNACSHPDSGCALKPNLGEVFNGTYHESTYKPEIGPLSIRILFEGVSVSIYFTLVNDEREDIAVNTRCRFILDGVVENTFTHLPARRADRFQYQQLVFSQRNLKNRYHNLEIVTDTEAYINFDYAKYTYDDGEPSPTAPAESNGNDSAAATGMVIGVTIGAGREQEVKAEAEPGGVGRRGVSEESELRVYRVDTRVPLLADNDLTPPEAGVRCSNGACGPILWPWDQGLLPLDTLIPLGHRKIHVSEPVEKHGRNDRVCDGSLLHAVLIIMIEFLMFLMLTSTVMGALHIRTIDDTYGDSVTGLRPAYSPDNTWKDQRCSEPDSGCANKPDVTSVHNGTYHEATNFERRLAIRILFEGVSVSIYFTLAIDEGNGKTVDTRCRFFLDGAFEKAFTHPPMRGESRFLYQQLVFSKGNLKQEFHTLEILSDTHTYDDGEALLESSDSTVTSIARSPVWAIVGVIATGAATSVALIALALISTRHRMREVEVDRQRRSHSVPVPKMTEYTRLKSSLSICAIGLDESTTVSSTCRQLRAAFNAQSSERVIHYHSQAKTEGAPAMGLPLGNTTPTLGRNSYGMILAISLRIILLFQRLGAVSGALVNYTIDDSLANPRTSVPRPEFLPIGRWAGQDCSGCALKPDTNMAFGGTYSESTYNPDSGPVWIRLSFPGTAIYIYFIIVNYGPDPGVTVNTNCNFVLDGQLMEHSFNHSPNSTAVTQFEYDRLVFERSNLSNSDHTLEIRTEGFDFNSYINFDYAVYTQDDLDVNASTFEGLTTTSLPSATSSSNSILTPTNPNRPTSNVLENSTERPIPLEYYSSFFGPACAADVARTMPQLPQRTPHAWWLDNLHLNTMRIDRDHPSIYIGLQTQVCTILSICLGFPPDRCTAMRVAFGKSITAIHPQHFESDKSNSRPNFEQPNKPWDRFIQPSVQLESK